MKLLLFLVIGSMWLIWLVYFRKEIKYKLTYLIVHILSSRKEYVDSKIDVFHPSSLKDIRRKIRQKIVDDGAKEKMFSSPHIWLSLIGLCIVTTLFVISYY